MKRVPCKKVNGKRKAKRFELNYGGAEYVQFLHSLPCVLCGIHGYTEAAHVISRGAGGKAWHQVPLCSKVVLGGNGCHVKLDEHPWKLPEGTTERLLAFARRLYDKFHAGVVK